MPRSVKNLKIPPTRFGLNHYKALGYYPRSRDIRLPAGLKGKSTEGLNTLQGINKDINHYQQKIAQGPAHEPDMTPKPRKESGTTSAVQPKPQGEGPSAGPSTQPPADELFPTIPEIAPTKPPGGHNLPKPPPKPSREMTKQEYDDYVASLGGGSVLPPNQEDEMLDRMWTSAQQQPFAEGHEEAPDYFDPYKEWSPEDDETIDELDRLADESPGDREDILQEREPPDRLASAVHKAVADFIPEIEPGRFTDEETFVRYVQRQVEYALSKNPEFHTTPFSKIRDYTEGPARLAWEDYIRRGGR